MTDTSVLTLTVHICMYPGYFKKCNKHQNVMKRKIATHMAVFGLLVKTNSNDDWGSYRCNQTVFPSGIWEEQHTHYPIGSRLIPNLKLSTVCLRISLFDLSLIQSSHHMMPSETGTLQLAASVKRGWGMGRFFFLSGISFPFFSLPSVFFILWSGWLVDTSSFVLSPRVTSAVTWL